MDDFLTDSLRLQLYVRSSTHSAALNYQINDSTNNVLFICRQNALAICCLRFNQILTYTHNYEDRLTYVERLNQVTCMSQQYRRLLAGYAKESSFTLSAQRYTYAVHVMHTIILSVLKDLCSSVCVCLWLCVHVIRAVFAFLKLLMAFNRKEIITFI